MHSQNRVVISAVDWTDVKASKNSFGKDILVPPLALEDTVAQPPVMSCVLPFDVTGVALLAVTMPESLPDSYRVRWVAEAGPGEAEILGEVSGDSRTLSVRQLPELMRSPARWVATLVRLGEAGEGDAVIDSVAVSLRRPQRPMLVALRRTPASALDPFETVGVTLLSGGAAALSPEEAHPLLELAGGADGAAGAAGAEVTTTHLVAENISFFAIAATLRVAVHPAEAPPDPAGWTLTWSTDNGQPATPVPLRPGQAPGPFGPETVTVPISWAAAAAAADGGGPAGAPRSVTVVAELRRGALASALRITLRWPEAPKLVRLVLLLQGALALSHRVSLRSAYERLSRC